MARFQVLARTLTHLGSELITSDAIAIYELIKNAIDARSKNVNVLFSTLFNQNRIDEYYLKWICLLTTEDWKDIIVEDLEELISRHQVKSLISDEDNEIINKIKQSTTPKDAAELLLQVNYIQVSDSGSGMTRKDLESIFLTLGTNSRFDKDVEGQPYLGNKGIGRISMMRLGNYAKVTSWTIDQKPFCIDFDWRKFEDPNIYLEDISLDAEEVETKPKTPSGTIIKIMNLKGFWTKYDIISRIIDGFLRKLRNPFDCNPFNFPIHIYYNGYSERDRLPVRALDRDLWNLAQRTVVMNFDPNDTNFLRIDIKDESQLDRHIPYASTNEMLLHNLDCEENELLKIGKLRLNLKWFNRRVLVSDIKEQGLSSRSSELRKELDLWSGGIAIYRDGFRIGNSGDFDDKDWFDIDKTALRGQGFTLNRIQIIGALEITHKENISLKDRSNREGLIENTQMRLLKKIINELLLPMLRESIQQDNKNKTPVELSELIEKDLENSTDKLSSIGKNISSIISKVSPEHQLVLNEVREDIHTISNQLKGFETMVGHLSSQREDILELAGTGTMTHVVMHELARSTSQAKELLKKLSNNDDPEINKLLLKLEQEIKAINVRIRQFDPMSISGRNTKAKFDLVDFVETIISGYQNKAKRHNISISLTVDSSEKKKIYMVKMVKGFTSIAIENLLANSCYWLKQDDVFSNYVFSDKKEIRIDIDTISHTVSVWDSGVGISYSDRERIFLPGYTTKKSTRDGKGFGLFIAREVTKFYGGDIYLNLEKDKNERLRMFIVELPKNNEE